MPFAVTKWGYSPDPRSPAFCPTGFEFGALTANRWVSRTTGAQFPYEPLNSPFLWVPSADSIDSVRWVPDVPLVGVPHQVFTLDGWNVPQGGGAGHTIQWICQFFPPSFPDAVIGTLLELWPPAIRTVTLDMSRPSPQVDLIPNPVVFTPTKWNVGL